MRRRRNGWLRDGRRFGGGFGDRRGGRNGDRRRSHCGRRRRVGPKFEKEVPEQRDDEYERQDANSQTGDPAPRF